MSSFGGWGQFSGEKLSPYWTKERLERPLVQIKPPGRERKGRKAKIAGAPNFRWVRLSETIQPNGKIAPIGIAVTPPVPAEFDEANCQFIPEEDKEKFFCEGDAVRSHETAMVQANRDELWNKYCSTCPVQQKCFEWAMAYEEWGIWAGTTEKNRDDARKNKEILEYGRNRLAAGYQPYTSIHCSDCGKVISSRTSKGKCQPCSHRGGKHREKK